MKKIKNSEYFSAFLACGSICKQIILIKLNILPRLMYFRLSLQVLEWPAPRRKGLGSLEGPSINSVAMDPELTYMVALSDKNMVIIWKKEECSWAFSVVVFKVKKVLFL